MYKKQTQIRKKRALLFAEVSLPFAAKQGRQGVPGPRGRPSISVPELVVAARKGPAGQRGRVLLQQEDVFVFDRKTLTYKKRSLLVSEYDVPFVTKQGQQSLHGTRVRPIVSFSEFG